MSHLLGGVPVQRRPLQDEPEALPLLGEEDTALLSLLPQPAVTVRGTQLTAGHTTPAHGRRHSWENKSFRVADGFPLRFWPCFNDDPNILKGRSFEFGLYFLSGMPDNLGY